MCGVLLFRVNREGTILGYKAGSAEDLAVPPGDFVGKQGRDVLPPDVAAALATGIRNSLDSRVVTTVEYELPLSRGIAQFEARIAPHGADEAIALVRNITERKQAEAALREREEKMREASRLESLGRARPPPRRA